MTELSHFILESYQVRKTKAQKQRFIQLMRTHLPQLQIQEGGFLKSKNLIFGDPTTAKVLLTAHYDTCAQLPVPNFIAPRNPLLSVLYSFVLIIPIVLAALLANYLLSYVTDDYWVHYWASLVVYFGLLALILFGPANKHTANDNTSGIITLCELINAVPDDIKDKIAFVFFDNEESGLIGSALFRKKYSGQLKNILLINFDCVSDGDNILLAVSKTARKVHAQAINESFTAPDGKQILIDNAEKVYYPSDQAGFPCSIAVAALKHKRLVGYYMDRIHTNKDTVFDVENIRLLRDCTATLLQKIVK